MEKPSEWVALAFQVDREAFVARCSWPILLAANEPEPQVSSGAITETFADEVTYGSLKKPDPPRLRAVTGRPALYPVRKVHTMIPLGIILGRAPTSDILLADRQVSKSHALFRSDSDGWMLSDIGSRNGTCVNERRLEPHSEAVALRLGDIVSFGYRAFFFLDAATSWERIRAAAKRE